MSTKLSKNTSKSRQGIEKEDLHLDAVKRGMRLRFLRNMTGMVTHPFSELCGVGRTTIRAWEKGISPLTERGAEKVISHLRAEGIHCTTFWLLHGIGEKPKIVDQDKLSKLNYPIPIPNSHSSKEEDKVHYGESGFAKEIELFKTCYTEHLVYCMVDDTMYPTYQKGDWVGGVILPPEALELAHDIDCIARLKNESMIARRVRVETLGVIKLSLYGTNAHTSIVNPPVRYWLASQFTGIAPIIRVWRSHLQTTDH